MIRSLQINGRVAAAAALLATAACGDDGPGIVAPDLAGSELFRSYVALGNSLTAGWQSGGITDSTQRESYAYLLATAAGLTPGEDWIYPALVAPGCPPPVTNYRTLARGTTTGTGAPTTGSTCLLRDPNRVAERLHNVAVPLAFAWDLTRSTTPTAGATPLQTIILGGRTQLRRALEAQPTFASIWIGNNEALAPASVGKLTPVAGASPGLVPVDTVRRYIGAAVDTLAAAPTLRGGVLVGVVDVRNAPRLFAADSLFRGAAPSPFKLGLDSAVGRAVTVLPNCAGSGALISAEIVPLIRAGVYPPVISCAPVTLPGVPAAAELGDLFVLNTAEQTALGTVIAGYNAYIRAKADSVGWAYFDPNGAATGLPALRASGLFTVLPRFTNETAPFGPGMSIDGVHPRRAAHVVVANGLVAAIKAKYPQAAGIATVQ